MKPFPTLCFLFFLQSTHAQTIRYVNAAAVGANNGSSWANAFTQLQSAIDAANPNDEIWVAKGVYTPSIEFSCDTPGRCRTFLIDFPVRIYGGFSGLETLVAQRDWQANPTILSGDIDHNDLDPDGNHIAESYLDVQGRNAYHVLWMEKVDASTVLDGFVITGGYANGSLFDETVHAGALYCNADNGPFSISKSPQCSPTIKNCLFSGNFADFFAGAVYNNALTGGNASPVFEDCRFDHNRSDFEGGALYNVASSGTSQCNPRFLRTVFSHNRAAFGGAMVNESTFDQTSCSPQCLNCLFHDNEASFGGAVRGLSTGGNTHAEFYHCTFSRNEGVFGSVLRNDNGASSSLHNSVVWGNEAAIDAFSGAGLNINADYTMLQESACPPGVSCGSGMLFQQNPQFVNPAAGNFRLSAGAAAINSGDNSAIQPDGDPDLDGNLRIWNAITDLGAYEFDSEPGIQHFPPVADYTADQVEGCAPLTVHFYQTSLNDPISFNWEFPGGSPAVSTDPNPMVTYAVPGVYDVSLTATNPAGSDTRTLIGIVVVHPDLSTSFVPTVTGFDVAFALPTDSIGAYHWDFGDGATSTLLEPVHTYAACGVYTVTLSAMNDCGTSTSTAHIMVGNGLPMAAFSPVISGLNVNFMNTSGNATAYTWDFGDGATSTQAQPAHAYAACGTYTVTLTASNACGTAGSTSTVTVGNGLPMVAFNPVVSGLNANFTNTTGNATAYAWDFGDGATSTQAQPAHTYTDCGVYTVVLTATNLCGTASTSAVIETTAPAPVAAFTASSNGLQVNFLNTSIGGTAFWWDFGDGATSPLKYPFPHTYADSGSYLVTLIVSNGCGSDTITQTVVTQPCMPPLSDFIALNPEICAGNAVQFQSQSLHAVQLLWTFPGGTPMNSAAPSPTVTYAEGGVYTVILNAINACGNEQEIKYDYVYVTAAPTAAFTAGTAGLTATFQNNSENATQYHWDFGDGSSSAETAPAHTYAQEGVYTVTLTAENECGTTTVHLELIIGSVGTEETTALTQFSVMPNPATDWFEINLQTAQNTTFEWSISDPQGRCIRREKVDTLGLFWQQQMNIVTWPAGMYVIQVNTGAKVFLQKLLVVH